VRSKLGGNLRLQTPVTVAVSGTCKFEMKTASGANPNPLFKIVPAGQPRSAPATQTPPPAVQAQLKPTPTLDVATQPGGVYTITPAR
jgi:hypothetical protein